MRDSLPGGEANGYHNPLPIPFPQIPACTTPFLPYRDCSCWNETGGAGEHRANSSRPNTFPRYDVNVRLSFPGQQETLKKATYPYKKR